MIDPPGENPYQSPVELNARFPTVPLDAQIVLRWRNSPTGHIRAWTEGRDPMAVGQMLFIPSRVKTSAMACDGAVDTRSLALRMEPEWLRDVVGMTNGQLEGSAPALFQFKESNIEHAMRRMFAEVLSPGPLTPAIVEACSTLVAIDLVSRLGHGMTETRTCDPLSELRTRHIEAFVRTYNCGWPPSRRSPTAWGSGSAI